MPLWEHIIGYEEGEPHVWEALALGYPRFVVHPYNARLFRSCERLFAKFGESCFAFPSEKVPLFSVSSSFPAISRGWGSVCFGDY
jgi:cystathionine gamma-synthase